MATTFDILTPGWNFKHLGGQSETWHNETTQQPEREAMINIW